MGSVEETALQPTVTTTAEALRDFSRTVTPAGAGGAAPPGFDGGDEEGGGGGGGTSGGCPLLPGLRGGFAGSFGFGGGGGGTDGGGERSGSFTGSSGLRIVSD